MLTERGTAIPRINIKVGKTKSDGVSPFHWLCYKNQNFSAPVPKLSTMTIPITVKPL